MKELSIEEKAKRYDEAIKIANEYYDSPRTCIDIDVLPKLFPELKESEDERIWNELIEVILALPSTEFTGDICKEDVLAWLEKQCQQNPVDADEEDNDFTIYHPIKNECSGRYECSPYSFYGSIKSFHNNEELVCFLRNCFYREEDCEKWCQEQGEQKPEVKYVHTRFRVGDVIVETKPNGYCPPVRVKYISEVAYSCESDDGKRFLSFPITMQDEYKLVEQKPADKVEPKFKVGDWVVYTGYLLKDSGKEIYVMQVASVEDDRYNFTDTSTLCFDSEKDMRSWTIQDAKDGDVLVNKDASYIVLFKKFSHLEDDIDRFKSHCHCREGVFCSIEDVGWCCNGFHPATKEQRDTLMKAMADAGYTFDFEKKELKKIEQKSVWSEEDELSCFESALFTAFSYAWQSYLLGEEVNVKQWAKEQSKELLEAAKEELKGNNTAWSEEDEEILKDGINLLSNECSERGIRLRSWLKSLKDRVQPQPQSHWKPTEEQIEALESATANCAYSEYQDCLRELIRQLKAL